jgi:hypothetical protein
MILKQIIFDPLLEAAFYRSPSFLSRLDPLGAAGMNSNWKKIGDPWFIELQRYGADLIQGGIVLNQEAIVQKGIQVLEWGFDRQGEDGDFPGTGDPFHSVELFLEGAARGLILLEANNLHLETVVRLKPKVAATASWLSRHDIVDDGKANNLPYTHRHWIQAAALGAAGYLLKDPSLLNDAAKWANEACSLQQADGVNIERGGFDVNYQSAGLLFALRYFAVCLDPQVKEKIKQMVVRGLDWLLARTDDRGLVSPEGSTRTGKEKLRNGVLKEMNYMEFLQVLCYAHQVIGDVRYRTVAAAVVATRQFVGPEQLL